MNYLVSTFIISTSVALIELLFRISAKSKHKIFLMFVAFTEVTIICQLHQCFPSMRNVPNILHLWYLPLHFPFKYSPQRRRHETAHNFSNFISSLDVPVPGRVVRGCDGGLREHHPVTTGLLWGGAWGDSERTGMYIRTTFL